MSRVVSFVVLVAVILLVTGIFFRVMLEFVVPMFLAAVLVVVFRPLHKWMLTKVPDRPRVAAAGTTACVVLVVLLPGAAIAWNSYREISQLVSHLAEGGPSEFGEKIDSAIQLIRDPLEDRGLHLPATPRIREYLEEKAQLWAGERAGNFALVGAQWVFGGLISLVIGLAIMIISLYYFLADGPGMLETIMRLSPLDDRYEQELLDEFSSISRAVVVATLVSAFVQGVLAGIGYYFADLGAVFLLTGMTMLLAMIPFLGAAAVWIPTCAWIYFIDGRATPAILLAIYCASVVSMIDNVIKPFILHGQSNLHPLLALLSVLGGVAAMGPVGILVGPMAVSFLQALLGMLRHALDEIESESNSDERSVAEQIADKIVHKADGDDKPEPNPHSQQDSGDDSGKTARPSKRRRRSPRNRKSK